MERQKFNSGTEWEPLVGYSRAVRVGRHVYVSGTTSTDATGNIVGQGDAYEQTRQIIQNIREALVHVGASLDDVVRTRIYAVDINQWRKIGQAHEEAFGGIRPATSMVEVSRLIDSEILVEMEADAFIHN